MSTGWVYVIDAARRLGLSRQQVHRRIASGALPAVKAGTGRTSPWRISERAVEDYARTVQSCR